MYYFLQVVSPPQFFMFCRRCFFVTKKEQGTYLCIPCSERRDTSMPRLNEIGLWEGDNDASY